ncbi:AglZ/HisF2 family acetamidino modification protein [Verrucomicrobia bacterium]|nr:AglZ/HisF2 family acetamidino modification protein [Verrucomicrobiota bacterium]
MRETRVIPALLLKDRGLYKTEKFRKPVYLGDPVNIIRIFNDKEVDEVCVLDIKTTVENRIPDFEFLEEFSTECFMPVAYGGGLSKMEHLSKLFEIGFEKCILNTAFFEHPKLVEEAVREFGSQSIVLSMDVRRNVFKGWTVFSRSGTSKQKKKPEEVAQIAENRGIGEIFLTNIDREGTMKGYDLALVEAISSKVSIPVIANGGAGRVEDFQNATEKGASAVAAGAFFVFTGPHKAVLINTPSVAVLDEKLS